MKKRANQILSVVIALCLIASLPGSMTVKADSDPAVLQEESAAAEVPAEPAAEEAAAEETAEPAAEEPAVEETAEPAAEEPAAEETAEPAAEEPAVEETAEPAAEEPAAEETAEPAAEEPAAEGAILTEEATTYTSGDWQYEVTDGGARLTKYTGSQSSVTIPDKIGGYSVTKVGSSCMSGNASVKTLTIPANIVNIEYGAFKNCYGISKIYFNAKSCNVSSDAFLNAGASASSLEVIFGSGVTVVPVDVFRGSESNYVRVTSVTISDTVRTIGSNAFLHCHDLKTIKWGSKIDTIDYYAFANCYALTTLNLPSSLSKISYNAFENCRDAVTLTIPASVTEIGAYAFKGCISLSRINYNAKNASVGGSPFMNTGASADKLELVFGSGVTVVPSNLMTSYSDTGYSRVTSVKFSDTITTIRYDAFRNCQELRSVTWGSGLVTIEHDAFRNCIGLTSLSFPSRLSKIGYYAFAGCVSLKNVTVPATVTSIEYNAFDGCTDLTKVTIYSKNTTYGSYAFRNCSPDLLIYCYKDSTFPKYGDQQGYKYKYLAGSGIFSDVTNPNAAYYVPVYWGTEKGIVAGYSDGTFRPNNPCTRGQVVMFLWRAAGKPNPKSGSVKFSDVKSTHPYYKAILWASQKGIAAGYSNGTFKPDDTCTRGQIVMFLWRYAGKPTPKSGAPSFPDVKTSHPYYTAIRWAAGRGITTGFTDGTFRPDVKCTRGQCITFIYRYMK